MPGYRTDLNDIFSAMDLFVYPSLEKDTSPLALLSALSAGLPVGVSNIYSLSEITNLCPAVDIFNPKSLEEIILLLKKYEDPKLRRKCGEINRKSGVNYFDISNHSLNMVQTIEKAYRNTIWYLLIKALFQKWDSIYWLYLTLEKQTGDGNYMTFCNKQL